MPEQSFEVPELTIYEILREAATEKPESPALSYLGKRMSYGELLDMVDSVSGLLSDSGVESGDAVVVGLHNCPEAVIALYAANRIGAVAVMVHPLSSKEDISKCLKDNGCKVAFVNGVCALRFLQSIPQGMRCSVVLVPAPGENGDIPKTVNWNDFISKRREAAPYERVCSPEAPAAILYTGGTTGTSKGAVISSVTFNASAIGMKVASGLDENGQKMLSVLPLFHGFGLCTGVHLPVTQRIEAVLIPRFTPESVAKVLFMERPSVIFGVPTVFEKMLEKGIPDGMDLSFLAGLFCGGDAMPPSMKRNVDRVLAEHGCKTRIRIGYGCTECLSAVTITPENEERENSVGIPLPGCEICIMPIEGQPSENGEGEVCVRGPVVMNGYLNQPDETAKVLRRHSDGKIWLHTGDVGRIDEDGSLIFERRLKRIIITSGYNVYPSELERCLDSDPRVKASCVVGIPDGIRVASVKAFIILKDGVEKSVDTLDRIRARLTEMIPTYAVPREFEFLDSFPQTLFGKVSYRSLENGDFNGFALDRIAL